MLILTQRLENERGGRAEARQSTSRCANVRPAVTREALFAFVQCVVEDNPDALVLMAEPLLSNL